jgi:ribose transport system permease protein
MTALALPAGRNLLRKPIWVFAAAAVLIFIGIAPHFVSAGNAQNILLQSSTIGFISLGLTVVMINGNIDLSVGSVASLAASLAVGLQGLGVLPAVIVGIAAGMLIGLLNGLIVWKSGIDSFIVTLGTMTAVRGVVFLFTQEQSFAAMNLGYSAFGSSMIGPFPTLGLLFLLCAAGLEFMLLKTVHGRNAYAVGGGRQASMDAGLKVGWHMTMNFVLSGFFAAIGGIALSTQLGASTPNMGSGLALWTITAIVVGGTNWRGGSGNLIGTVGGVLAIAILRNGLDLMHVKSFYVLVVLGVVLIAALVWDRQLGAS